MKVELTKYLVKMYSSNGNTSKVVYANSPSNAIFKADADRKYKKYVVYQNGVEIKTRTRL